MNRNPFSQYQTNLHKDYTSFAENLRGIFETFLSGGNSIAKLQKYLNSNKIPSFYGKPWSYSATTRVVNLLGIKTQRSVALDVTWIRVGDRHLGCPAYPLCAINPQGCIIVSGKDVEWYGHQG